jgi:hypothetical protein
MGEIVQVSQSGPISPLERVKRNEEAVTAVAHVVKRNYIKKIGDKGYLMVPGAQALGSSLGYTTAVESIRYVPPTEHLPGYWEAIAVVFDRGVAVGRGMGGVFDDERQWAKRDHFARQMMAQTRATGRALKGVMGWATALLGAEVSLAEEMPAEGSRMPQDASEVVTRVPSLPSPPKGSKGQEGGLRRVRAVLAAVQAKESKAGKPYWRVGLEASDGVTDWYTSFDEVAVTPGVEVEVTLKPYKDGELVSDVVAVPVGEEVPF